LRHFINHDKHYQSNRQGKILEELRGKKDVGPTCGFAASLEVGLGATVDTLQTGYLCVYASREDKRQGICPRAATRPTALDHATLLRWAPVVPHGPWLQTPPPCTGGLRCYHVFRDLEPHLTSPQGGGALALPCVPWLWIPPLFPRGSVAATCSWLSMGHGNKERHSCTRRIARHAYYRGTPTHCRGACKTCGQMTLS
jgi:hypothetical protein